MLGSSRRRLAYAICVLALGSAAYLASTSSPVRAQPWDAVELTRGPYLQIAHSRGVTIVWRQSRAAEARVLVGRRPGRPWANAVTSVPATEHAVALSELQPDTRYYYEVQSGGRVLAGGRECSFVTYPEPGAERPFRFIAWGDSGTADGRQREVADRMTTIEPEPDLALILGDIVYSRGEREGYDPRYFSPYAALLGRFVIWPAMGNHDSYTENGAPYLENFWLPTDTGAPDHSANTERYYTFDYGCARFVCLDSATSSLSANGDQARWCEATLAAARQDPGVRFIIVYMHHSPYTRGTHDSNREGTLVRLRETFCPLFDRYGVDLVLVGHSHVYERSHLLKNDRVLTAVTAPLGTPAVYTKARGGAGTIYMVSGCGGQSGSGPLDHPVMADSVDYIRGTAVFDVDANAIHSYFLEGNGNVRDPFTLAIDDDVTAPRLLAAGTTAIARTDAAEVTLTFSEAIAVEWTREPHDPSPADATFVVEQLDPTTFGDPDAADATTAVEVHRAWVDAAGRRVSLDTDALEPDTLYRVTVTGAHDPAGNELTPMSAYAIAGATPRGIARGARWRYLEGKEAPPTEWAAPDFDDSMWPEGPAGIGYGDGDDATVLEDMPGNYITVYVRRRFSVEHAAAVDQLLLRISYDDSFVAFLNGHEVARALLPRWQDHTTRPDDHHEAGSFELFDISAHRQHLVDGVNVLAIEGHNVGLGSSDFTLHPTLEIVPKPLTFNRPPIALATAHSRTVTLGQPVRLSAAGTTDPDGEVTRVLWDPGDGTPPQPAGVTGVVEYRYKNPGAYTITLIAIDDEGATALARINVYVEPTVVNGRE